MAGQTNFIKVSTAIRSIKSDIGMVRISLFNDQIALQFQPSFGNRDENGNIKYNGKPEVAPNVRFSMGVGAAVGELIRTKVIPAADSNISKHWDVFACKRKNYESYLAFDVKEGHIVMTGTEVNNGVRKQASYSFPVTQIKDDQGNPANIQGEAFAFSELLREIGGDSDTVSHLKQYSQAIKDNFSNGGGYNRQQQSPQYNMQSPQPMSDWHP